MVLLHSGLSRSQDAADAAVWGLTVTSEFPINNFCFMHSLQHLCVTILLVTDIMGGMFLWMGND